MKTRLSSWILITLLVAILTACQKPQTSPDESQTSDVFIQIPSEGGNDTSAQVTAPEEDKAYPVEENQPNLPPVEAAYPITEEDLGVLLKTWTLSAYAENEQDIAPSPKTLTFNADNSFEIITETTTITGQWTSRLGAVESTLILKTETDELFTYQIIDLEEVLLTLRSYQEGIQIDEQYRPAD